MRLPSAAGSLSSTDATRLRSMLPWRSFPGVAAVLGDVADLDHRARLLEAAGDELDLLVNNGEQPRPDPAAAA